MEGLLDYVKHLFPNGALFLAVIGYTLQEHLAHLRWWPKVQWAKITLWVFLVWCGYAYGEIFNPHSDFRTALREWRSNFDVVSVVSAHKNGANERVEVWCTIKFLEDIESPRLVVRVKLLLGDPPGSRRSETKVVGRLQLRNVVKDETYRFQLIDLPISKPGWTPRHSAWVPKFGKGHTVVGNSKNIVEVSVNGFSRQFYVERIDHTHVDLGRIFVLIKPEIPIDLIR